MHNSYSGKEKRRSKRAKAAFLVAYKVDSPAQVRMTTEGRMIDAVMLDLSAGGMSISTNYNIPVSSLISMSFTLINEGALSDSERILRMQVAGEVVSSVPEGRDDYRLGIRFMHISEADKRAIADFIAVIGKPEG